MFSTFLPMTVEETLPGWGGGWCAEGMCGREVLLLQGLDQVGPVLGVDAPQGTFPAGLRGASRVDNSHIANS